MRTAHSCHSGRSLISVSINSPRYQDLHTTSIVGLPFVLMFLELHLRRPLERISLQGEQLTLPILDSRWQCQSSSVPRLQGSSAVATNSRSNQTGNDQRSFSNIIKIFFSLERIQAYLDIDHEPKSSAAGLPPAAWPRSRELQVDKMSTRYSAVRAMSKRQGCGLL